MSFVRVVLRVVLVAAVVVASGCGDGGGGEQKAERRHIGGLRLATQHAEWGISVCRQIDPWINAVNSGSAALPRQFAAGADRQQVKAGYVAFFADMVARSDRLVTTIGGYGDPAVGGGKATGTDLRAALERARAVLTEGRAEAEAAPTTGRAVFQQALDQLQARIDEGIGTVRQAYAHMEKTGPLPLRRLLGQRDECGDIYKDSPTGIIPVEPDTR